MNDRLSQITNQINEKNGLIRKAQEKENVYNTLKSLVEMHNDVCGMYAHPSYSELQKEAKAASLEVEELERESECIREGRYYSHIEKINYFYGKLTEEILIDTHAKEITLMCIKAFFEYDRTKSKSEMFEQFFGGIEFISKSGNFILSNNSVKVNWSINRLITYIATMVENDFFNMAKSFYDSAIWFIGNRIGNNPSFKYLLEEFEDWGYTKEEIELIVNRK